MFTYAIQEKENNNNNLFNNNNNNNLLSIANYKSTRWESSTHQFNSYCKQSQGNLRNETLLKR